MADDSHSFCSSSFRERCKHNKPLCLYCIVVKEKSGCRTCETEEPKFIENLFKKIHGEKEKALQRESEYSHHNTNKYERGQDTEIAKNIKKKWAEIEKKFKKNPKKGESSSSRSNF